MSDYQMRMIQGSIGARQQELHNAADILAKAASEVDRRAAIAKVVLIFLGAFAATKGATDQIVGASNIINIITYTVAGLLVATIAGLEAAFKFETRATELKVLAASCQATIRQVDSQWQKEIGTAASTDEKLSAARRLLDVQDTKLADIQEKAARNGVNITLEIRELYREETPYLA
jgi:hypothetical protein